MPPGIMFVADSGHYARMHPRSSTMTPTTRLANDPPQNEIRQQSRKTTEAQVSSLKYSLRSIIRVEGRL